MRPNGVVHRGAITNVVVTDATALVGDELDVTGLRVQFLRAVSALELTVRLTSIDEQRSLPRSTCSTKQGNSCISGVVRPTPTPPATTGAPADGDRSRGDIAEPWRRLPGLEVSVNGEVSSMDVTSPIEGRWAPLAYAATLAGCPGATLAGERKEGAEFITTALTLDLETPLWTAASVAARGWKIAGGGKLRSFASHLLPGGGVIGFGTATYYQIR